MEIVAQNYSPWNPWMGSLGKIRCNKTARGGPADGPPTRESAGLAYFLSRFPFYIFRNTIATQVADKRHS